MILHVVTDEKFIDCAYKIFETATNNNNRFILPTNILKLKYIKEANVELIPIKVFNSKGFAQSIDDYELVVLYGYTKLYENFVLNLSLNIPILWIGYGFDYYSKMRPASFPLLLPKTQKLVYKQRPIELIKEPLKSLFRSITGHTYKKLISRINYFAPILEEEYELCKKNIPGMHADYVSWNFDSETVEYKIKQTQHMLVSKDSKDILLGNSSSYSNNHIEAIDLLAENDLIGINTKIILPLSYGDEKYRNIVIEYAKKKLGESPIIPLVDFMPKEEYTKVIADCRYVVMNHLRQQAMGNINIKLRCGASVFLNKSNPAYIYYKKLGIKLFTIDDLKNCKSLSDFNLTPEEAKKNYDLLLTSTCFELSVEKTRNFLKLLQKKRIDVSCKVNP